MKRLLLLCIFLLFLSSCAVDVTMTEYSPSLLTGEKNLLFIWQPECGYCQDELKELETMYQDFDLNIMGIGVNDTPEAIQLKKNSWDLSFPNYLASESFFNEIKSVVSETPSILFLDREGRMFRVPEEGKVDNLRGLLEEVEGK